MSKVIGLMPTPIYQTSNAIKLSNDVIDKFTSGQFTQYKKISEILDKDEERDIESQIHTILRYFSENILGMTSEVFFEVIPNQSVLISTRPDEMVTLHDHQNSIFTVVYYITTPPESSPLTFYFENHIFKNFKFNVKYTNETEYNRNIFSISAIAGDIVIFPSWISHFVPKNISTETRYTLSFQTFLRGKISSDTPISPWERYYGGVKTDDFYSPDLKLS